MEDLNNTARVPFFKKIDRSIFDSIDKFKLTPGHNNLQDFYNSLDEDQQKFFKALVLVLILFIPALLTGFIWWKNNSLKVDLQMRMDLISKASEIIGQKQGLGEVGPNLLSSGPIDGESMMSSRLSSLLSSSGIDLSKIQVSNTTNETTGSIVRAEADFKFSNMSTEELINLFSNMILREKFRIQQVQIQRNADTNLLNGEFHAIHFAGAQTIEEE